VTEERIRCCCFLWRTKQVFSNADSCAQVASAGVSFDGPVARRVVSREPVLPRNYAYTFDLGKCSVVGVLDIQKALTSSSSD
jgi:hypothetical protein